jgi:hypothetical protein
VKENKNQEFYQKHLDVAKEVYTFATPICGKVD